MRHKSLAVVAMLFPCFFLGFYAEAEAQSSAPATKKEIAFDHTHSVWSQILKKNIVPLRGGKATALRYKELDKKKLESYVNSSLAVKKTEFDKWKKNQQLAFYFNLYNALTVQLIVRHYPVKSIKDIGSWYKSTWKKEFFTIFGKKAYLDKIEHEWVRKSGKYKDPRVHFAFNCASVGCPALGQTAFVADKLEAQLEAALVTFLSDATRNSFDRKSKTLMVSKIFDWYGEDFAKGWKGYKSLKGMFAKYATTLTTDPIGQKLIKGKKVTVKFNTYDWKLNDAK